MSSQGAIGAATRRRGSLRSHLLGGMVVVVGIGGGLAGWAATAELSGAVIAPGMVVVDSSAKKVQHPTGGVVGMIRVKEGDAVRSGDILVILDETQTRANLKIVTDGLDELSARQARLLAERDGDATIAFADELIRRRTEPLVAAVLAGESRLFETRQQARVGQKAQLVERKAQLEQEANGLRAQLAAKERSTVLVADELKGLEELQRKNLISANRVNEMRRMAAQLDGERGQLLAQIAAANGKAAEIGLQMIQIDQDLRNEVGRELADIRARTAELVQRKIEAEDRLKRVEIRAPQDGIVHELAVHTVGGVVQAGETLMLVVPSADLLAIEARVPPFEIDRLTPGQKVTLRFTAFDQRITPVVEGEVGRIAADVTEDKRTGAHYYSVRVKVGAAEVARLGAGKLIPGMPVEAYLRTGERSALSYFLKPLTDQMSRAFRDG